MHRLSLSIALAMVLGYYVQDPTTLSLPIYYSYVTLLFSGYLLYLIGTLRNLKVNKSMILDSTAEGSAPLLQH